MSKDFDTLTMLWEKAKDHLDEGELKDITNLDEHAEFLAGNLSSVVNNLGCLVSYDESGSGTLTNADDVSRLLFSISNQIDYINGLFRLSTEASSKLERLSMIKSNVDTCMEALARGKKGAKA